MGLKFLNCFLLREIEKLRKSINKVRHGSANFDNMTSWIPRQIESRWLHKIIFLFHQFVIIKK